MSAAQDYAAKLIAQGLGFLVGKPQVIKILKIEPKLPGGTEEVSEALSDVARNRACAIQNLGDAIGGHAELSRQFRRAHIERFQSLGQVFTRMNYSDGHSGSPSDSQPSPRAMGPGDNWIRERECARQEHGQRAEFALHVSARTPSTPSPSRVAPRSLARSVMYRFG